MRNRLPHTLVRSRREQVHNFRCKGYTAEEIYTVLKERFPTITVNAVYRDIDFLKHRAREYIINEYLPSFGDEFSVSKTGIDQVIEESWTMYYTGTEETQTITLADGKQIKKHIKQSRNPAMLRLALDAYITKVNLGNCGPIVANVQRLVAENQRLTEGKPIALKS